MAYRVYLKSARHRQFYLSHTAADIGERASRRVEKRTDANESDDDATFLLRDGARPGGGEREGSGR
jgi:hypothetical protein